MCNLDYLQKIAYRIAILCNLVEGTRNSKDHKFSYQGPRIWNSLSQNFKEEPPQRINQAEHSETLLVHL